MIAVKRQVHFGRRSDRSRAVVVTDKAPPTVPPGRVPRVARLTALAIHLQRLLGEGHSVDQSELARQLHVTQPRMTQIMNLTHLAPDIQEEVLFLPRVTAGRERITERSLRPIARELDWGRQRQMWRELRNTLK